MWRFVLIGFGFLAFAFYEASGGADYAPAPNSLQVAMRGKPLFAPPLTPEPAAQSVTAEAEPDALPPIRKSRSERATAQRSKGSGNPARTQTTFVGLSGIDNDAHDGFEITLASATRPLTGGQAMDTRSVRDIGMFDAETLVQDVRNRPIEEAIVSQPQDPADMRRIAGTNANMRSGPGTDFGKVDQLSLGAEVEVLDRRGAWVELRDVQTGQTGWMADWLVTAAN